MIRWLKFNAVDAAGLVVQLGVLGLLVRLGLHYLATTGAGGGSRGASKTTTGTLAGRGKAATAACCAFNVANVLISVIT